VAKVGVRELPLAVAASRHAATTVASSAALARLAGIRVLATGGIGGVHRRASETFDESADLPTLARTAITVVCAGVKSILDVPATLERLETLGVTVVGYRTLRFPGFYVADSGHDLDWAVSDPDEIAEVMRAADRLGLANAIVIANPVPVEHQLDPVTHDALLADALAAADREGVHGKAVTPFLLDHVYVASGGASLEANIWAVRNNVALAARIARAWVETNE
jgi:pseudouridine-5'-phosphate glycosidase